MIYSIIKYVYSKLIITAYTVYNFLFMNLYLDLLRPAYLVYLNLKYN